MKSSMTWLLRQELQKPLVIKNLRLYHDRKNTVSWGLDIMGPAARYFGYDGKWNLNLCALEIPIHDIVVNKNGPNNWRLSGRLSGKVEGGTKCRATITGEHRAFGSLKATNAVVVAESFSDKEILASPNKLEDLAKLTGARIKFWEENTVAQEVEQWIGEVTGRSGIAYPTRYKTIRDFYWVMGRWWFWCLLFGLPLEVIIRRWPYLTLGRRKRKQVGIGVEREVSTQN